MQDFNLVAHRGYPLRFPDNSLVGIRAALQAGARFLEIDVQLSRSGTPWLFHDESLIRVAGCEGSIVDLDDGRIAELRASEGARFGDAFAREPVARLREFVAELEKYPDVFSFVEIKPNAGQAFGAERVVSKVIQELQPLADRLSIISFSMDALHEVARTSALPHGLILESWEQLQTDGRLVDSSHIFCNHEKLPVEGALDVGTKLAVYEVVDPALARELGQRGAHFVETFAYPEMRDVLGIDP
ncbi:MAG: glycerophosphoryl diester phosphodiesterase [Candidatus Paceibacteria bacterium]|jgi:glycerophosphoryl diester phosphodiesterase